MANSRIYLKSEAGGTTVVSRDTTATSGNLVLPASGNVVSVDTAVTDNAIARYDNTTGKLQNSGVIIDDNGNVGIGTSSPARKLEVQSYGVGASGILRISGLAGSPTITNTALCELSITGGGGGTITQNITARYNNGYEIATYFVDRVSWRDIATNTQLFAIDSSGNALVTNSTGALGYGTGSGGTVTQLTSKSTAVTLNKPNGLIILNNAALAANASVGFILNNNLINANDHIYPEMHDGTGGLGINYNCWVAWIGNGSAVIVVKNISGSTLSDTISIRFKLDKGAIA